MDRAAFIAGRILQLTSWRCDPQKEITQGSEFTEECHDLVDAAIAFLATSSSGKQGSIAALQAAIELAQRREAATVTTTITTSAKVLQATTKPQPAVVKPPSAAQSAQMHEATRKAHDVELEAIRELLSTIRSKATNMRSQVKASDTVVADHVKKLAGVVQGVSDADHHLQRVTNSSTSTGTAIARILTRVPVVGPAVLVPLAAMIMQALWIALAVLLTIATISAMLVVPKG